MNWFIHRYTMPHRIPYHHSNPKLQPALLGLGLESRLPLELELELGPEVEPKEEADDTAGSYLVQRGLAAVSVAVVSEAIAAARLPV